MQETDEIIEFLKLLLTALTSFSYENSLWPKNKTSPVISKRTYKRQKNYG